MLAWILLFLSVVLNAFLVWYAIKAAAYLRNVSEEISIFWAEVVEYKKFLDSIMDMHAYTDDGTIKSFVEATKKVLKEIDNFREFCELSDLLTEEDVAIIDEMEEDYEQQQESVMREQKADEHVREWDRQTAPTKTTRLQ